MSNYASAAKPLSIGGGVFVAPAGTALPTSTEDELNEAFVPLGYISADGVTRNRSDSSTEHKVWGGAVAAVTDEGYTETINFKVVEAASVKALELAYGQATGTLETGITAVSTAGPRPTCSYVVDMLLKDNVRKRIVVPRGVVSTVGETVYRSNDLIGTELTVTAMADASGATSYDYTKAVAG